MPFQSKKIKQLIAYKYIYVTLQWRRMSAMMSQIMSASLTGCEANKNIKARHSCLLEDVTAEWTDGLPPSRRNVHIQWWTDTNVVCCNDVTKQAWSLECSSIHSLIQHGVYVNNKENTAWLTVPQLCCGNILDLVGSCLWSCCRNICDFLRT